MEPRTASLLALFTEGRTRFTKLLDTLTAADLPKKLAPSPNSAGFLIRHIGDVELLFAKNVFTLAALFCDYMPPANTKHGKMTATAMYLSDRLAKIQKAGLDALQHY